MIMNRDSPTRPLTTVEAFETRQSTWALIESQTIEEERTEIKKLIGSSLIEETVDLHGEVETLLEIWRDFRDETDELRKGPLLPEPPNVRENLIKQIQLFVKLIQERTAKHKRDLKRALSPYQSEIVSSICNKNIVPEKPQTACSSIDGRQTPLRPSSSRSQSSCSSRASDHFSNSDGTKSSEEVELLADIIREDLEDERNGLYADIGFLQQCLMDESNFQASVSTRREPNLKELQDIGLRLEKELLISDAIPKEASVNSTHRQRPHDSGRPSKRTQASVAETSPRKVVPSPPSSAPTSKSRTSIVQRKQLTTKVMQFPTGENVGSDTLGFHADKYENSQMFRTVGPGGGAKKKVTTAAATNTVGTPCVISSIGSNSRKLRQLVLDSRESHS